MNLKITKTKFPRFHNWLDNLKEITSDLDELINRVQKILRVAPTVWILGIIYKFALDIAYILAAYPVYQYAELEYFPNSLKYVVSIVLYLFILYLLPKNEKSICAYFLHLQFIITIAPMLTYYALADKSTLYMLMVSSCVILQILILRPHKDKKQKLLTVEGIRLLKLKPYFTILLSLLVIISIVIPIIYNGFAGFKVFNLEYLYLLRDNYELPGLIGYVLTWTYYVIIPFGIVSMIKQKNLLTAVGLCAVQLLVYIISGNKSTYLIIPVLLVLYWTAKRGIVIRGFYLLMIGGCLFAAICGLFLATTRLKNITDTFSLNLFSVRFVFLPACNKFFYYEFFRKNAFTFFSDGQFGRLFSLGYPYRASIGQVIFSHYLGRPLGASNSVAGYLGESFAQAGFVGMASMSVLLGYIIRFVSLRCRGIAYPVQAACLAIFIIALNDNALFTTLLSSGLLLMVVLFFVFQAPPVADSYSR